MAKVLNKSPKVGKKVTKKATKKKEWEIPVFTTKEKLADFLKATVKLNEDLIDENYLNDLNQEIDFLYQPESDPNYNNDDEYDTSYEDSYN